MTALMPVPMLMLILDLRRDSTGATQPAQLNRRRWGRKARVFPAGNRCEPFDPGNRASVHGNSRQAIGIGRMR